MPRLVNWKDDPLTNTGGEPLQHGASGGGTPTKETFETMESREDNCQATLRGTNPQQDETNRTLRTCWA